MKLIIRDHNIDLSDTDKKYIRKKMKKMDRYLKKTTKLDVLVADIRGGDKEGVDKKVQATTKCFGKTVHVEEISDSIRGAVDQLEDRLLRTLRKTKEKTIDRSRKKRSFLKRLLPTDWFNKE